MKPFAALCARLVPLGFLLFGVIAVPAYGQTPKPEAPAAPDPSKRITISFQDAPVQDVAEYLVQQFAGTNCVVPPRVGRLLVTLKLRNVNLDQALQALVFATENRISMNEVAPGVYGFQATQLWDAPSEEGPKAICRIFSLASVPELNGAEATQGKFMVDR